MSKQLKPGDPAIWNDGLQDIPVTIEHRGRDATGIYCRVSYACADGSRSIDRVHPSQLRPILDTLTDDTIKQLCMGGEISLDDAVVAIGLRAAKRGDSRQACRNRVALVAERVQHQRKAR